MSDFKYSGLVIDGNGKSDKEINDKIYKAGRTYNYLKRVLEEK